MQVYNDKYRLFKNINTFWVGQNHTPLIIQHLNFVPYTLICDIMKFSLNLFDYCLDVGENEYIVVDLDRACLVKVSKIIEKVSINIK